MTKCPLMMLKVGGEVLSISLDNLSSVLPSVYDIGMNSLISGLSQFPVLSIRAQKNEDLWSCHCHVKLVIMSSLLM